MKIRQWPTYSLVTLLALVAIIGLAAYLVFGELSLRRDTGALRQELATLRETVSQYQSAVASDIAAAREDAATGLAQAQASTSERLDALERGISTSLDITADRLARDIQTVQQKAQTLEQDVTAFKRQADDSTGLLRTQLTEQSNSLGASLLAAQSNLQKVQGRLDSIEGALAQGLATLESKLQKDVQSLTTAVANLSTESTALSDRVARLLMDVPSVYARVKDAVVQIKVTRGTGEGSGSGFLYGSERRHVVTAHHVIKDATVIRVIFPSGQTFLATLVGESVEHDVAVLALPVALSTEPLTLGDSSKLTVGQPIMLVGSPLNEPGTTTAGIVSALNRTESYEEYTVAGLIQFDAAANRGNSGGPLFNAAGEVVGICVAGVTPSAGSGMSFAVPSNNAAIVINQALR